MPANEVELSDLIYLPRGCILAQPGRHDGSLGGFTATRPHDAAPAHITERQGSRMKSPPNRALNEQLQGHSQHMTRR